MNMFGSKMQSWGKPEWRDHLKTLLQKESPFSSVQIQQQICENLGTYLLQQKGVWAGYLALPQEPDLTPIYRQESPIEWVYPRMEAEYLAFYSSQNFIKGPFGVMEPTETSQKVNLDELAGVLVPGLGFSKEGHRLGKGRGFYDRALEDYPGLKIGICFNCQVFEQGLPTEEHDIQVDLLVTEKEIIKCNKLSVMR